MIQQGALSVPRIFTMTMNGEPVMVLGRRRREATHVAQLVRRALNPLQSQPVLPCSPHRSDLIS